MACASPIRSGSATSLLRLRFKFVSESMFPTVSGTWRRQLLLKFSTVASSDAYSEWEFLNLVVRKYARPKLGDASKLGRPGAGNAVLRSVNMRKSQQRAISGGVPSLGCSQSPAPLIGEDSLSWGDGLDHIIAHESFCHQAHVPKLLGSRLMRLLLILRVFRLVIAGSDSGSEMSSLYVMSNNSREVRPDMSVGKK